MLNVQRYLLQNISASISRIIVFFVVVLTLICSDKCYFPVKIISNTFKLCRIHTTGMVWLSQWLSSL